jgi:hypothetical protein
MMLGGVFSITTWKNHKSLAKEYPLVAACPLQNVDKPQSMNPSCLSAG